MSKYQPLWEYVSKLNSFPLILSFDDAFFILGFKLDHSFLTYKKEAEAYNFVVQKISLKEKKIVFDKI